MHLKLRNLEMFRLFAQTENVTETARLMRISQPAVSQVLKDLEEQVGIPLFKRFGRGLQLTPEARLFLPEVERLTSQIANVRNCALSLRDGQGGALVVACIPTLANTILPQVIAGLRSIKPNVRLNIKSYTATEISRQVRLESADIGATFLPINDAGVRIEPLLRTAITCLVPKTSLLAKERMISPQQLKNECVIAQGPETPPGFVLRDYLKQAGLDDWPTLEVNQSIMALSMAEQGIGVALAHPLVLSTMNSSKVTAVPFEPQIPLTLALVYPRHRDASIHVDDFVRILKKNLSEISKSLTSRGLPCEML